MKNIKLIVLPLLIILILFMVFPGVRASSRSGSTRFFSGLTGGLISFGGSIGDSFSFFTKIGDLRRQNKDLGQKIVDLSVDTSQMDEIKIENQLLKKELGLLDTDTKGTLVPARIIDRDPIAFLDIIVIDKGSDDGIAKNMAVISSGVLVGQVKEVYSKTSMAVLITSKDSLIQAMLQECRAKGILKGGLSGIYLENIQTDTEYKQGEFIVTSGLGGTIKQGILIGRAGKLESSSSGIFKTINVEPILDLSKLEVVFIQK